MSGSTTFTLLRPHDGGDTRWQADAECRRDEHPSELWFPIGTAGRAMEQAAEAKAVCRRCPAMDACREWALNVLEFGVAGGLDENERRAERRRRAAARKAVTA